MKLDYLVHNHNDVRDYLNANMFNPVYEELAGLVDISVRKKISRVASDINSITRILVYERIKWNMIGKIRNRK